MNTAPPNGHEEPKTGHDLEMGQMKWESGRAGAACSGSRDCLGPYVCNLGFGPDGESFRTITTCNRQCQQRVQDTVEGAWVVCAPEGRENAD